VIGTAEADVVAIAGSGINLNADEATADVDMTITGTPLVSIEGAAGDDMLSVDGPASASAFEGGEGVDTIDFGAASGGVSVDLKAGTVGGQGSLMLKAVENVTGSPGDDEIVGDEQANVLAGGDGDDVIDGGGEADTLLGGDGRDTVSFASSNKAVQVDLKKGTAEGAGADTLDGFEDVEGSRKADAIRGDGSENTLDGSKGIDRVRGGNGDDDLLGAEGNDLLFGEKGNDVLQGETGKDQLNGGEGNDRCKGGPDADAFVFCEHLS
jgi:Ca2+-binding RTX toxin-like protein